MKAIITVAPAKFQDGIQTITIPFKALYRNEVDVKNAQELSSVICQARNHVISQGGQSAVIFIKPLSRKFGGFDAWEDENRALLKIKDAALETDVAANHWVDIKKATLADAREVFHVSTQEFRERVQRNYSGDQVGWGSVQGFYMHGQRLFAITSLRQYGDDWLAPAHEAFLDIPRPTGNGRVRTIVHKDRKYGLDPKPCVVVIEPSVGESPVSSPVQLGFF